MTWYVRVCTVIYAKQQRRQQQQQHLHLFWAMWKTNMNKGSNSGGGEVEYKNPYVRPEHHQTDSAES